MCSRQACDRIGLVEPDGSADRSPQPLDVGLAEDRLRPALVREGDDRPVAQAVGQPQRCLCDLAHARLADALAVEVGEELGLGVAADRAEGAAHGAELVEALDEPGRRIAEAVRVGALDVGAPDVLVGVEDVDVAGAGGIRLARDRAHERRVLDQGVDPERLTRLEVEPDLDGEPRIVLKSLVGLGHGEDHSQSPRPGRYAPYTDAP